jgi:hypothetical protein
LLVSRVSVCLAKRGGTVVVIVREVAGIDGVVWTIAVLSRVLLQER